MGTGKTTIATQVANRLKMKYVSTDSLIEKREKRTINEIFTDSGEEYFRDAESDVVREASGMENVIIDAGGGAVLGGLQDLDHEGGAVGQGAGRLDLDAVVRQHLVDRRLGEVEAGEVDARASEGHHRMEGKWQGADRDDRGQNTDAEAA